MAPTQPARTTATRTPRRRAFAAALTAKTTATVPVNCAAAPSKCGYPDATNSGVPAGTTLKTVPGQVSSGPGWHYDSRGWVEVTGNGANLTGLNIPYNVDVQASNVTLNDDNITTSGTFGVSLRHTAGATVENSTINGTNTGFAAYSKAGVPLRAVPGQVSSGPGWHYDSRGWVEVTGNGAVLSYLSIPYNVDITASNVTLNHDSITTSGTFGVSLRHTAGVTVENSTISGTNATSGRVNAAVSDVYGDSTGAVVKNNNISDFRIGVQLPAGTITGNYLHDAGYVNGDHTDGIMAGGSTAPTTIKDNTVFISLDQTDAITIDASGPGQQVANQTVEGNFLAGGDYALYAGAGNNAATSNIHIENNRFAQQYFTHSGQYGADAYYNNTDPGNVWTGNIWDTTGQPVTP